METNAPIPLSVAVFPRLTFSYRTKTTTEINEDAFAETYVGVVILESRTPKFLKDDQIEQLRFVVRLDLDYESEGDY